MHPDASFASRVASAESLPLTRRAAHVFSLEDAALRELAARSSIPFPLALQALFHTVLSRWQGDEVTAVASACEDGEWRVTRLDLRDDPAWPALIGRMDRAARETEPLGWDVDGEQPLPLALTSWPPAIVVDGPAAVPFWLDPSTRAFDLALHVECLSEGARARVVYRPGQHVRTRVERMARDLQELVQAVPRRPAIPLGLLFNLDGAERRHGGGGHPTRGARCFHERVDAWVRRAPDEPAIRLLDENLSITYRDLDASAAAVARVLIHRGVRRGDRVAVCMGRSPRLVASLLGILMAGGACVLLDPADPPERLGALLAVAAPAVTLAERATRDRMGRVDARPLLVEGLADEPVEAASITPQDSAWIAFTWERGVPRGVPVSHRAFADLASSLHDELDLEARDVVLGASGLSSCAGFTELMAPLAVGACVGISASPLSHLGEATVLHVPSHVVSRLVDEGVTLPAALRVVCSGPRLSGGVVAALAERVHRVVQLHGRAEAGVVSLVSGLDAGVARPLSEARVYVLDHYLRPLPVGAVGDLYLAGAGVAAGYLDGDSGGFHADPFHEGGRMFHTGDQARWREDGQLELLGPREMLLSHGGRRVDAREIERVLGRHPDVREVAVTLGAGGVTACIVTSAPHASLDAHARRHLPPLLVPSTWVRVGALPRTPDGRLDVWALPGTAIASASRRRPLEGVLARLCAEVLDVSRVDPHEDFFELGGDSLAAARLIERIRQTLGRQVDAGLLFAAPTVAALAALLERAEAPPPASLVAVQPLGTRAPLYCVHPASGSVIPYQALAVSLGTQQPLYGLQASGLYGRRAPRLSVADMAEAYLAELRGVQSRGPWHLTGFGFGAVIAFEMAVRLRLSGEEVGLVALMDGPCPHGGPDGGGGLGYRAGRWLSRGLRPVPSLLRSAFFRDHHRALERTWEPTFYPGRVTVLQTLGRFPDASLGWRPHAASVEPVEVRVDGGRHRGLLEEPAVHAVARLLAERIGRRGEEL